MSGFAWPHSGCQYMSQLPNRQVIENSYECAPTVVLLCFKATLGGPDWVLSLSPPFVISFTTLEGCEPDCSRQD